MFWTVPLSIIRSFSLYTQQYIPVCWELAYFWNKTLYVLDSSSVYHQEFFTVHTANWYVLLCVQWKTPDDWQRNCPKHVDPYSKNKFEKLVHLVRFIVRNFKNTSAWSVILSLLCRAIHSITTASLSPPPRVQQRRAFYSTGDMGHIRATNGPNVNLH